MKIVKKVIGDKVLVKPDPVENKTAGGVFIPDASVPKPKTGEVIAVGSGIYQAGVLVPMETKVGDKVSYAGHVGSELVVDGQSYLIMQENKIDVVL